MANLGELGEKLVAQWLESQGWTILHHRWRCRWGEIDLIAQSSYLIFVEVKTRSDHNWDLNGRLAITPQKQAKIWETSHYFLSEFPNFSEYPCRFDVALVMGHKINTHSPVSISKPLKIQLNQPVITHGYQLTLIEYLENAF